MEYAWADGVCATKEEKTGWTLNTTFKECREEFKYHKSGSVSAGAYKTAMKLETDRVLAD